MAHCDMAMRPVADPYDNPSESSGLADILEIATAIEEKSSPTRLDRSRTTSGPVHLAPRSPLESAEPLVFSTPSASASATGMPARGLSPVAKGAALGGIAVLLLGGTAALLWPRDPAPQSTAEAAIVQPPANEAAPSEPEPSSTLVAAAAAPLDAPEEPAPEDSVAPVVGPAGDAAPLQADIPAPQAPAHGTEKHHRSAAPDRAKKPREAAPRAAAPPRPTTLAPAASRTAPAEAAPPVAPEKKFSTDCILDPSLPGCGTQRAQAATAPVARPAPDPSASLPDKLTQSQIRDGIEPLKSKAKACGDRFGAPDGTTIRIKLSIEGATGKTLSAAATPPHAGDPLGTCVADALRTASFPRFKSTAQGTTFPVKL